MACTFSWGVFKIMISGDILIILVECCRMSGEQWDDDSHKNLTNATITEQLQNNQPDSRPDPSSPAPPVLSAWSSSWSWSHKIFRYLSALTTGVFAVSARRNQDLIYELKIIFISLDSEQGLWRKQCSKQLQLNSSGCCNLEEFNHILMGV